MTARRIASTRKVGVGLAALFAGILVPTLTAPSAMAIPVDNDLLVADSNGRLLEVDLTTGTVDVLASRLGFTLDVAVGPNSDRYVVNGDSVVRVPAQGGPAQPFAGGFGYSTGVAVDGGGNVFVADREADAVYKISPDGQTRTTFASFPAEEPSFLEFETSGDLLVSTIDGGNLYRVAADGTPALLAEGLEGADDIAVEPNGSILVANENTGSIFRVPSMGGTPVEVPNSPGVLPVGVASRVDGTVLAGTNQGQIVALSSTPGGQSTILATGAGRPFGMAAAGPPSFEDESTPQTITFESAAPTDAQVGDDYAPAATGGASGNDVTFSAAPGDVCTYDEAEELVSFIGAGTCTVTANQAGGTVGDVEYAAAEPETQDITVAKGDQIITFTSVPPANARPGGTYTVTANAGESGNPVTFTIEQPTNGTAPCAIAGSTVTFTQAGTCTVLANQAGNDDYNDAETAKQNITITNPPVTPPNPPVNPPAAAATTTTVTTTPDGPIATVTSRSGTPTGTVTFRVDGDVIGTATLAPVQGQAGTATAQLDEPINADDDRVVSATYNGTSAYQGSVGTYERENPTITARVISSAQPNAAGWYNQPVTIRFTCTPGSADLDGECPGPVQRRNTVPTFELERTITAVDGGADTTTVAVKVDTRGPVLNVTRVGENPYTRKARPVRCNATDGRSGVDGSCRVTYGGLVEGLNGGTRRVWTASATDVAGNTSTRSGSYVVRGAAPQMLPGPTSIG